MKEILFHPFIHTLEETIKLIPFLFIAFLSISGAFEILYS